MSNLLKRISVATVGIPLLLFAAIHGSWPLQILIVLLQIGTFWEWRRMCAAIDLSPGLLGVLVGVAGVDTFVFFEGRVQSAAIGIAALSAVFLIEYLRRHRRPLRNLSAAVLFIGYVALPLVLWHLMGQAEAAQRWQPLGPLAALFIATWTCDTAAYAFGRWLGRHKLDPAASPNKTVEGFVAGIVFAAAVLPLLSVVQMVHTNLIDCVALTVIVGLGGQVGDLLESLIKREVQVKDTSSVLPGHGGFMDRFDSLLLSSPLLLAYLLIS